MKNNFILKSFYILFILFGIQFAYAGSSAKHVDISFYFKYGTGIESIVFDQKNMFIEHAPPGDFTVTDSWSTNSYVLTVHTGVATSGSSQVSTDFNEKSPRMEAGGLDSNASSLDFFFAGTLIINGHPLSTVPRNFAIAHENYKSSNSDWWIADTSGNASLYENGSLIQMTVKDDVGNYYCLDKNGTNYQIIVTAGDCITTQTYQFTFKSGKGGDSEFFVPLESPESGQVSNIQVVPSQDSTINVTAVPINSPDVASSFNSLMTPNYQCDMDRGNSVYDFEVHVQGQVCGPIPQNLDFYIAGNLIINDRYVVNPDGNYRTFVLAHGDGRWWLGTLDFPFEAYGGGGAGYQNHATVKTADGSRYQLVADSQASLTIKDLK